MKEYVNKNSKEKITAMQYNGLNIQQIIDWVNSLDADLIVRVYDSIGRIYYMEVKKTGEMLLIEGQPAIIRPFGYVAYLGSEGVSYVDKYEFEETYDRIVICPECREEEFFKDMHWHNERLMCRRCIYGLWKNGSV